MSKKLSLAVLLSGNGTNFQAIVDSIENGRLKAAIKIVISNNKDAFGLKRAKKHNIKNLCLDHKDFEDRKSYDKKLKEIIKQERLHKSYIKAKQDEKNTFNYKHTILN